jgi:cytidylate kinase
LPPASTLRVRLVAPRQERIAHFAKQFHLSTEEAERQLERIDQERRTFVQRHFHANPEAPENYDLHLNTARFSAAECAEMIVEALYRLQDHQRQGAS